MLPPQRFRMLATDLDGTLLRNDQSISLRTRHALALARSAGMEIILVTGRPPRHVRHIADDLGLANLAICGNGALVYDPVANTIIRHNPLTPAVASALVLELRTAAPGIYFACEQELVLSCEPAYLASAPQAQRPDLHVADALVFCERPITKLMARHPELPVESLLALAREVVGERALATYSGAPFVEVSSPAAEKALALAWLAEQQGITAAEVLAFGDMPNDVPMLRWAGHGVAMANAHHEALIEADEVAPSNESDGVAVVLERLLAER